MKKKDVAIIGAGASGLMCAIECARKGLHVSLFEQNKKPAKKILVSGNGRCNISNVNLSRGDYFSQNPSFVEYALNTFDFKTFQTYMQQCGLLLQTLDDGRAYPLSNEAKSVVHTLLQQAKIHGVEIYTEKKITTIKHLFDEYQNVVIATGSEAASHLGGCADGYHFAQEFGHSIVPTFASLVQLHLNTPFLAKLSGVKLNAKVTLLINNQRELEVEGDLLFTNYGISGFGILDISHYASEALSSYQMVDISLNLLPYFTTQQLAHHLLNTSQNMPKLTIYDILIGVLPTKVATVVVEELALHNQQLTPKLSKKIANTLHNWKFEVTQTHGFRHAEVSGGGVDTSEINPHTFASFKKENLYFTGEVLDVVGKRGGYNFAFAWASGFLCAKNIIEKKGSR